MAYAMDWKKILIISALLLAPLALMNCGSAGENNAATSRVGPSGPTYPNRLYFDLTAETIIVAPKSSVVFTVRVWDALGNMAANVVVYFSGGGGKWDPAFVITDANGMVHGVTTVDGGAGTIMYVTVTVENMSLTIPVQIISTGGPPAK